MKEKLISIIVPIYKGEKYIKKNLEIIQKSISKYFKEYEIVAVIDGALDKSFEQAKKVKGVKVVGYKKNRGKGAALMYGFKHSNGKYITFIDSDMDLHPDLLRNFIPYMSTADMVIGSKRHPFSKLNYPFTRKILSKAFQIYQYLFLGINLKDTQSGIKLFKRELLEVILPLIVVKRYAFDLELCFLAMKHEFRIVEAPIYVKYKFNGSGVGMKAIIGMATDVLAIRYRYSILKHYQKQYHKEHF